MITSLVISQRYWPSPSLILQYNNKLHASGALSGYKVVGTCTLAIWDSVRTIQQESFMEENFREVVEIKVFMEKTFMDCLLVLPKDATPPNRGENFRK